jgi:large subunit ribosomal protein L24
MALQRLQTGDTVVVISGRDKGKSGLVKKVLLSDDKVVVEGINLVKRHTKPSAKQQQGGIVEKELPIFSCKVMPVDPSTGKGTRVATRIDTAGKKVRVAVGTGAELRTTAKAAG